MIKGLGIDIVRINRVERLIERWGEKFLKKIFTPDEIKYCSSKACPATHFAARFAVKEAAVKMIGGNKYGLEWHDFMIKNNPLGQPELVLSVQAKEVLGEMGIKATHISISHEEEYAIAQVIGEGE